MELVVQKIQKDILLWMLCGDRCRMEWSRAAMEQKYPSPPKQIPAVHRWSSACPFRTCSSQREPLSSEVTDKTNSVVLACERTIPNGRPPLVGDVSANFWGQRVSHGQHDGSPWSYSQLSRSEQLLFLPSSSSIEFVPDPVLFRKSGSAGNRTQTSGSVARNSDH
jgi:hypothetical protein